MSRSQTTSITNQHYDQFFSEIFSQYTDDVYRMALGGVLYDDVLAQELLYTVFTQTYKYVHALTQPATNPRLYILVLVVKEIRHLDEVIPSPQKLLSKKLKHKLTPIEEQLWQTLNSLPRPDVWLVFELLYGEKMSMQEIAVLLERSLLDIQQLHSQASQHIRSRVPSYIEYIQSLYDKRNAAIKLSGAQRIHVLRQITTKRKAAPTFIHYPWWQRFIQPKPIITTLAVLVVLGTGVALYRYLPNLFTQRFQQASEDTSKLFDKIQPLYITQERPRTVEPDTTLPTAFSDKLSLISTGELLYGSDYVYDHGAPSADDAALVPTITMELPAKEYIPVLKANIYAVPEALTEDQLQYAALRHFSSLPLNQFQYVNGTYYIAENAEIYQPLFIAFNADGGIDFQMRQQAICTLSNLTKTISENEAETAGFSFLSAHNFLEVAQSDLLIQLVSHPDRTIAKNAFCLDDDQTPVQDREVVFYPPQTVLRYDNGVADELPLRLRGIAVQLHGENVTNVRIDKLFLLQQYVVKTQQVEVRSLADATTALQQFTYPAAADRATVQQTTLVFMQWNHTYGSDRLATMKFTSVDLEYVYDELNHIIEPYYIFNGEGQDSAGRALSIRAYVAASTEMVELRSPYRE
ncbi:MAG: hypothetical protein ACD_43C00030G0009 [uncultured bacterium]|nr:MAG: hypothetical protein ACD_43C00030G0009 [uncultured bacterium]